MSLEVIKPIANFSLIESIEGLIVLRHDFGTDANGNVELSPGVPIATKEMLTFVTDLDTGEQSGGFINPKLIYQKGSALAWLVKGSVRTMKFNIRGAKFDLTFPVPNLVFYVLDGALRVYAVKDDVVGAGTEVFHAPLFNMYTHATLCTGSVKMPTTISERNLAEWESVIFDTYFAHSNHRSIVKFKKPPENVDMEYIELMKGLKGKKKFPNALLAPFGKTLGSCLED